MDLVEHEALFLVNRIDAFLSGASGDLGSMTAATRRKLSEATRRLNFATETPTDTIQRIMLSPLQLPLTIVGIETRLFEVLGNDNGETVDEEELAAITSVDPALLKRLLRYYQSFGMIDQPADDQYRANDITSAIISPCGRSALPFYFYGVTPALNAIPRCLRDSGYQDMTDGTHFPFYVGHDTNKNLYDWMEDHRVVLNHFMSFMVSQRDGERTFLDVVDFKKEFISRAMDEDTPVFVDIGGSFGHQCVSLRQKYPDLVGRVILQDSEEVIQQARSHPIPGFESIESQAHNFLTPQPVEGALVYYMRNILHNWADDKCVDILRNIKSAMTHESQILVDDMVFPESGAHWRAAQMDFVMGSCFAGRGRTGAEWDSVFHEAGYTILKRWMYSDRGDCVTVVVPK
ncbi:S-adenosyl-L-methionine-dependent methyltransferase [Xylaria arbuscula]|nr:S-adenosyl-L-methionine-dependent methyltransferase [Xylaria arbuscula]